MTNKLLDTTKAVGTTTIDGLPYEVCGEALATHDRPTGALTVNLRAFLRAIEHTHLGESANAKWLPLPEVIHEHVDRDEASETAKDVFASWCHKVRKSIPKE